MKLGPPIRLQAVLGRGAPRFNTLHTLYRDSQPVAFISRPNKVSPLHCGTDSLRRDINRYPGWRVTPCSQRTNPGYSFWVCVHRDNIPLEDIWRISIDD